MRSGQPVRRGSRGCSRASCREPALRTLTYIYADSTAILGELATFAEPHAYDLCLEHSEKLTLPNGWTVIRSEGASSDAGPNNDDIMAIADAVREVGAMKAPQERSSSAPSGNEIGRRGHLRAIPSQ
jgi:Protein of unknown function (DUF3499)